MSMSHQTFIDAVRTNAGEIPRKYSGKHRVRMQSMERFLNTSLTQQSRQSKDLVKYGQIVWGGIVQANMHIFASGKLNMPANIIYSPDNRVDSIPECLGEYSHDLYALKGQKTADRQLQKFADRLADERGRQGRIKIPRQLTKGIQFYLNDIQLERRHLPDGYLQQRLLPIFLHPTSASVMVVPYWYWPADL